MEPQYLADETLIKYGNLVLKLLKSYVINVKLIKA